MDPTIRQIIFSRIIMLARKVATDLCLLSQSLPCIFVCTICSGAFASHRLQWKPDNARAGQDDISSVLRACWMLATGAADDELKNITESEHHILLFSLPSFTLQEERRNIIVKGNPVFILMRLLVLLRSYLWAPGHQGLVRSEDSCKQNSSKK